MDTIRGTRAKRHVARIGGLFVGAAILWTPGRAAAHFVLKTPANWMVLDSSGGPQKIGPCGNETPGTPSNAVTPYQPGDTVTIQLDEVVFHPGHYRVALAPTQNDLPAEPVVTPSASDQCATAAVQMNPTLPILGDNLLVHTAPFAGTQTATVTLPANPPCTNCVLQVLEFMSSHGAPCFYHHCANITIGGSAGGDAGNPDAGGSDSGSAGAPPASDSGCSCSTAPRGDVSFARFAPLAALAFAAVWRGRARSLRRDRRCSRATSS